MLVVDMNNPKKFMTIHKCNGIIHIHEDKKVFAFTVTLTEKNGVKIPIYTYAMEPGPRRYHKIMGYIFTFIEDANHIF